MWKKLLGVTIGFIGFLCLLQNESIVLGIILLAASLWIIMGVGLSSLSKSIVEIVKYQNFEKNTNVKMELDINIENVLKHRIFEHLYKTLKDRKISESEDTLKQFPNKESWISKLKENYKIKYKKKGLKAKVVFNLKNNIIWKNGKVDFNDTFYYDFTIPYSLENEDEDSIFDTSIFQGITIRLLLVNGFLKLQLGKLDHAISPYVSSSSRVHMQYFTITEFPVIYFSYLHNIPEKYLNLTMYATDSYQKHLMGEKVDMVKDWQAINKDARDYNYLCISANERVDSGMKLFHKIVKDFDIKKDIVLNKESFENVNKTDNDDDLYLPNPTHEIFYINSYLSVFIVDLNEFIEIQKKIIHPEFFENNIV